MGWVPTDPTDPTIPFNSIGSIEDTTAEAQCLESVIHNKTQRVKLKNIGPAVAECMREKGWELKVVGHIRGG